MLPKSKRSRGYANVAETTPSNKRIKLMENPALDSLPNIGYDGWYDYRLDCLIATDKLINHTKNFIETVETSLEPTKHDQQIGTNGPEDWFAFGSHSFRFDGSFDSIFDIDETLDWEQSQNQLSGEIFSPCFNNDSPTKGFIEPSVPSYFNCALSIPIKDSLDPCSPLCVYPIPFCRSPVFAASDSMMVAPVSIDEHVPVSLPKPSKTLPYVRSTKSPILDALVRAWFCLIFSRKVDRVLLQKSWWHFRQS
jgi:hypothetical protein